MKLPKITPRLMGAVGFIRHNSVVADVGTDHAYLPIYLCLKGITERAVASDINEGPINRATANIRAFGLDGKIITVKTDGIPDTAIRDLCKGSPTDIIIFGMGGELISDIISRSEHFRRCGTRLILQPMTHPEILRGFLYGNGYEITDEILVKDDRIYQIICAEYTGSNTCCSDAELLVGKINTERGGELFREYVSGRIAVLSAVAEGKKRSGADAEQELKLIAELRKGF